jgi:hypothetical protein
MVLLRTHCRSRTPGRAQAHGKAKGSWRVEKTGSYKKLKNSGNEAKKYLKTKHITFLNAANYARFVRKLAQIGA